MRGLRRLFVNPRLEYLIWIVRNVPVETRLFVEIYFPSWKPYFYGDL